MSKPPKKKQMTKKEFLKIRDASYESNQPGTANYKIAGGGGRKLKILNDGKTTTALQRSGWKTVDRAASVSPETRVKEGVAKMESYRKWSTSKTTVGQEVDADKDRKRREYNDRMGIKNPPKPKRK